MASTMARELLAPTAITGSVTGEAIEILSKDVNFVGHIVATGASSPNIAAKIQHSHDKLNWFDLLSFTAITANTAEIVQVDNTDTHVLRFVRAVLTHSSGSANVNVDLCYDRLTK